MAFTAASRTAPLHSIAIAAVLVGSACSRATPADGASAPPAGSTSSSGAAVAPPSPADAPPGGPPALRAQATRAHAAGDFAMCGRLFREAAAASASGPASDDRYNAACCLARAGNREGAMEELGRAIEAGGVDLEHLKADPDLSSVRGHPRWAALVSEAEAADARRRAGQNPELARLFQEDQRDREGAPGAVDWSVVAPRDAARRRRVREIVAAGDLKVAADYYHAAMVFQHGEGTDYRQAHQLCLRAIELDPGHAKARRLAASTMDRWLMSRGEPQRYGTQFVRDGKDARWRLHPVDPAVTDEERARWGVPPLAEARRMVDEMNRK